MKKILALVLVLCMALAAIPALAEDFSGTWYMTLADVTLATFVLNEDGSADINMIGVESTGTWSAEGDTLTVTADNEPVTFTWDGTSFSTDLFPAPMTREPGKLTYGMVLGLLDPTDESAEPLPEGMAEDEALEIAWSFINEMSTLDAGSDTGDDTDVDTDVDTGDDTKDNAGDVTDPDAPAAADGPLAVLRESSAVFESYNGYNVFVYLELENVTDAPFYIYDADMALYDADGTELAREDYAMYNYGSRYLEPGEKTFLKLSCNTADASKVASYAYFFETRTDDWYADGLMDVDGTELLLPASEWDSIYMKATVTNNTDAPLSKINVVLALVDADGNILEINSESLYHELAAGSTLTFLSYVNSNVKEYCKANGIEPAAVEAYAFLGN